MSVRTDKDSFKIYTEIHFILENHKNIKLGIIHHYYVFLVRNKYI